MDVQPPGPGVPEDRRALGVKQARRRKMVAWAMVGSVWMLTALGASIDGAPAILTGAMVLLPWICVVALSGLALARQKKPFLVLLISFLFFWGRAWAPSFGGDFSGMPVTIMTWNVQRFGFEGVTSDGRFSCVTNAIASLNPDALALQEVTGQELEEMERALGMSCAHVDYLGTGRPDRGGLAVCARGGQWSLGETWTRTLGKDWHTVFAELVNGDVVFNLMVAHLHPYKMGTWQGGPGGAVPSAVVVSRAQVEETSALLNYTRTFHDPTVVAGDFNSPRDTAVHHAMRRTMTDAWEAGAWGPGSTVRLWGVVPMRVDYLYATASLATKTAWIPEVDCSDHRPLLSRFSVQAM